MRLSLCNRPLGFVPAFVYFFELTRGHLSTTDTMPFPKDSVLEKIGVLLDSNLGWKFQINNVALKISRTFGVVALLRHIVPRTTLLNIYQSLILPYLTYCLVAWGQAKTLCLASFPHSTLLIFTPQLGSQPFILFLLNRSKRQTWWIECKCIPSWEFMFGKSTEFMGFMLNIVTVFSARK